nr:hypothetical protein BaRGS_007590 [Batillaria attramentaria]
MRVGRFYVILGAVLLAWGVPVFPALSATTPAHFSHDVLACAIPRVEEFVLSLLLYFPVTVIVLGAYVFRTAYERRFHPYPTPKVKHVDLALFVMHDSNHRAFLMLICHHVLLIISYTLPSVLQRAFLEVSTNGAGDAPKNAKSDAVPNSGDLLGREKSPGVPQFAGPPREAQAPTETQLAWRVVLDAGFLRVSNGHMHEVQVVHVPQTPVSAVGEKDKDVASNCRDYGDDCTDWDDD